MVIEFLLNEVRERLEAIQEYQDNTIKHKVYCEENNIVNNYETRGVWNNTLRKFKVDGSEPTRSIIAGNLKMVRRLTMSIQRGE